MAGRSRPTILLSLFLGAAFIAEPVLAGEIVTYAYDAQGRLVQVNRSGTVNNGVQAVYSYDKADNRTNVTVTGSSMPDFTISDTSATEGSVLVFTVTRGGATSGSQSVNFVTSDGTASSGSDYTANSDTLTFAAGQTSQTISVATIDDVASEASETVNVTLSGATGGATISDASGVGAINDNDGPPPSFAINDASGTEGAGATIVFTVTRTGSSSGSYSVNFATANGTASSASDYVTQSGILTFASGEMSKTITIALRNGTQVESVEYFYVSLSAPTGGATIADNLATGTIYDDDEGDPCPLC